MERDEDDGPPGFSAGTIVAAKLRVPHVAGLPRERLGALMEEVWNHRLTLVVAPAGSGKTTLLAHFARQADCPVAWFRAEPSDGSAEVFLAYLEAALTTVLPGVPGGWGSVEDAVAALESWNGKRALLVIDDLHVLNGTEAERTLERLLDYLPPTIAVVAGSRQQPGFRLSRLRLDDALLTLGPDDLRFRSWEVEQLFWDFYGERLPPRDLAVLARRTEGWAAGLQLFHLATRGKRPDERRKVLHGLGAHSRLVRDYLADNVLDHLPHDLRTFLVETSVLGRMSGPVCDALLELSGSEAVLVELRRSQLFTYELGDGWYRYHEVLRTHLEGLLVEQVGETEAQKRYRLAGELLEAAGQPADAVLAYCRIADWGAVRRVLGTRGEAIATADASWLDALPPAVAEHDPWVLLASARRERADGRPLEALEYYRRAEAAFGATPAAATCWQERHALAAWVGPSLERRDDWAGLLRRAVTRDPLAVAELALALQAPYDSLVGGLAHLVAGEVREAQTLLAAAATHTSSSPALSVSAQLAAAAAALLGGDGQARLDVEWAAAEAHRLDLEWLAQLGRSLLVLSPHADASEHAAALRDMRERSHEPWGPGVAAVLAGLAAVRAGEQPAGDLTATAAGFAQLRASTLEAWCLALDAAAAVRSGAPDTERAASAARSARSAGVPGAEAIALMALAEANPKPSQRELSAARALLVECGLTPLWDRPEADSPPAQGIGTLQVSCLGGFDLRIGDAKIATRGLKPRARSLLRLLALHEGRLVHRESILAALWPDADLETGTRALHVALSSLRHLVPEGAPLIERDGEAYRLRVNEDDEADLQVFQRSCLEGRRARARGEATSAIAAYEAALAAYGGDLLPEEGPAEWVVGAREIYRSQAVGAAVALAHLLSERNQVSAAITACERALQIDRYRDSAWQQLIAIHEKHGNPAAAETARRRYATLLDELGIDT